MMETEKAKAALEAVLFTMGESVGLDALAAAIGEDEMRTEELLSSLLADYEAMDRGITIIRLEDRYQMVTKREFYENLIRVASRPKKRTLSEAALEVLSIIAYRQPVTRLEIEKIRGVSCDYVVNRLMEFGLVEETGRLQAPGRPMTFGTTEGFLRHFGLESLDSLPLVREEELAVFQEEAEEEAGGKGPEGEDASSRTGEETEGEGVLQKVLTEPEEKTVSQQTDRGSDSEGDSSQTGEAPEE